MIMDVSGKVILASSTFTGKQYYAISCRCQRRLGQNEKHGLRNVSLRPGAAKISNSNSLRNVSRNSANSNDVTSVVVHGRPDVEKFHRIPLDHPGVFFFYGFTSEDTGLQVFRVICRLASEDLLIGVS